MSESGAGPREASVTTGEGRVRIEATAGARRWATMTQWALVFVIFGLAAAGLRILGLMWPERMDPEIARLFWLFVGTLALAALTLAWLIVVLQDLVKLTIELDDAGVRVARLLQPFAARWDEVREIGVVAAPGHLTLRSSKGSVTATARLLGEGPFGDLVAALRARAGGAVREWPPWAGARRQLLLLLVPALGTAFVLVLGAGLLRRRPPVGRRPGPLRTP